MTIILFIKISYLQLKTGNLNSLLINCKIFLEIICEGGMHVGLGFINRANA